MNVAQKLVECLAAEGVEYIFGIPGEENLEVIEAIAESPIRFITTRHEQGAAFMADVYGRLTGKAGVCLATLFMEVHNQQDETSLRSPAYIQCHSWQSTESILAQTPDSCQAASRKC